MTSVRKEYLHRFHLYATEALCMAGTASAVCDGLKSIAKVAKSSCEAFQFLQDTYKKAPKVDTEPLSHMATNFTDVFNLLEPVVLLQECVIGDKDGRKPWHYFADKSYPKGLNWMVKKTKSCTKFAKYLHTMRVVNLTRVLLPFTMIKLVCDVASATIVVVDRGILIKQSLDSTAKLERRIVKWELRKDTFPETYVSRKLLNLKDRIRGEEKIRRKCAFKIACAVGLLALTILCVIALAIQLPWLNAALLGLGVGFNLMGVYKSVKSIAMKYFLGQQNKLKPQPRFIEKGIGN